MGIYTAWLTGLLDAAPAPIDPERTILLSGFDPPADWLASHFGALPHMVVLPDQPVRTLPGVAYHRFTAATNPILWDDAVDDAIRAGADTLVLLVPPHEVRGRTLLRLRALGVRRAVVFERGRFRARSPGRLALERKLGAVRAGLGRVLGAQRRDAMTEAECRAILADAAPAASPSPGRDLRVAHLVFSLNSGGAERQACNAAVGQKRAGFDVRLFTLQAPTGADGHYRDLLAAHGIPVRQAGFHWHPGFPAAWRRRALSAALLQRLPPDLRGAVVELIGELLTLPVDVLHCYVDHCNVPGLIAAALAPVAAVVLSFRNGNPSNFPGLLQPWMRPWYRAACGRPGLVLSANSAAGARDYEDWLGLAAGSVPVVRNAVEPGPVPPRSAALRWRREAGLAADAPVLAGVFRLQAEKRPLHFLECVARLRLRVPGLRVVLAGVGELEPAVRAAVAALGLGEVVRLLGQRRDVPAILAASDVLLLTSSWEGTPNVLLEAQHCGCVPVATDAGGTGEALRHGETGLLVGRDDLAGAVDAVTGLFADPARRRRLAAAGPHFVAERFAPAALLRANLELYRKALDW